MDQLKKTSASQRGFRRVAGGLIALLLAGVWTFHPQKTGYRGKSAGGWVEELRDNSCAAAAALRTMGPGAVPPLIEALERKPARWLDACAVVVNHSPSFLRRKLARYHADAVRREAQIPGMRAAAAQVLGDLGSVAENAVPALVNALGDPDAMLRRNAAFAVGKIGAKPELAVPRLTALLGDRNDEVRMYAAIALKRFGARAASAVPALIAALTDRSWQVRERAALALGTVGQDQSGVVRALEQTMRDEHRFVRSSAAIALASLAPQAKSARAALEQARYDPDAEVRYSAGVAMNRIESETRAAADVR